MERYKDYAKDVLLVVLQDVKKGVSGSTTADTLVTKYGFSRVDALSLVVGSLLILNVAGVK